MLVLCIVTTITNVNRFVNVNAAVLDTTTDYREFCRISDTLLHDQKINVQALGVNIGVYMNAVSKSASPTNSIPTKAWLRLLRPHLNDDSSDTSRSTKGAQRHFVRGNYLSTFTETVPPDKKC